MAHKYKRDRSPYWWIGYKDPSTGKVAYKSSGLLIGVGPDTRRADQLVAEYTLREKRIIGSDGQIQNWLWVSDFLKATYESKPAAHERYLCAWKTLLLFFTEKQIKSARQLRRQHCFDYLEWRKQPNKSAGKYRAGRNTAILEMKVLTLIMQEALRRELCDGNPCVKLGIKRERPKVKPDLPPEIIGYIREKITEIPEATAREFFEISFEIARYQGCRLNETRLNPMTDVVIETVRRKAKTAKRGFITFLAKGDRQFASELHPRLIPLFEKLQADRRTFTWNPPAGAARSWASSRWFKFFERIGLSKKLHGACFHSTRVTVATEMARNNVTQAKANAYMNHASTTTNRIYQRLRPKLDLAECTHAVG